MRDNSRHLFKPLPFRAPCKSLLKDFNIEVEIGVVNNERYIVEI